MIIHANGPTQLLITQPAHAALASRILRAWRRDGFPESGRRADILIAIEEHDNGWLEVDAQPLVDAASGKIQDFANAPDEVRRGVWPRGIGRLAGSPYAAALVAQHALHIYRRYRGEEAWTAFFAEMETAREHHLSAAGIRGPDELRRDYPFLRLADLASLAFCNGWTESQTDDAGSGYSVHVEGTRLIVAPDPFDGKEIPIAVEGRDVPAGTFRSAEDARLAFADAPRRTLNGTAVGRG